MDSKKEENKNIDDVKVTIGGREIKGITSMKYEDSNKIINYKKANKMDKKKIIGIVVLSIVLLVIFKTCKGSTATNEPNQEKTINNDSINKVVLEVVKKESKVKDAVLTDAKVLYIAVENDGTNRNGLASYFCEIVAENKGNINAVKIVEYGTMKSKNRDNAYGVLLGESTCK